MKNPTHSRPNSESPYIGAHVFIQPGQTRNDIEGWFRTLHECDMPFCRIRLDENDLHKADGTWDFGLYDIAFEMAAKYQIQIFADLSPRETVDWRLAKFPQSKAHLQDWARYIERVVSHYRTHPAMYAWVLQNEPGSFGMYPKSDLSEELLATWRRDAPTTTYNSKGYTGLQRFEEQQFQRFFVAWYLEWISEQVRRSDDQHELHVNTHSLFENLPEYDFAAWRKSITSLGESCHPSHHYSHFARRQYPMALSISCDITRSGAGHLPFIVTELQGGDVTYSGVNELCPTKEEITQWTWTSIGCGAQGVIFWCLNPRAVGWEAGEWALLDFQHRPSERMKSASAASRELIRNRALYATAKPLLAPVYLLYSKESYWMEAAKQGRAGDPIASEGRLSGAMIKSVAAWYEALLELGINGHVAEMQDFDWEKPSHAGESIILSHQLAIHSKDWERLRHFVRTGGKLIADGLTFFFDEHHFTMMQTGFPLADVMGASLAENFTQRGDFIVPFDDGSALPAHLFKGRLHLTTGTPFSIENEHVLASRNTYGDGCAVWIPSLLGLGARRSGNGPLANWLSTELAPDLAQLPIRFRQWEPNLVMRTMSTPGGYLTVLVNKSPETRLVPLQIADADLTATVLFADKGATAVHQSVRIGAEETLVIEWN